MKKLVFSFGRFNPPTTGHEVLLKKVVAVAKKENADAMVYSSQSNDPKKNPLPYKEKTKFMQAMFPKHKKVIQYDVGVKNAFDTLSTVYSKGYRDVTMVVGSDRVTEFANILNKYNDVEGKHGYYNFESGVKVVSAGARDPDAEGVTGMSASKMRLAAAANDFESFSKGMPSGFKGGQSVFDAVRKGMNLSEEMLVFLESDAKDLQEFYESISRKKLLKVLDKAGGRTQSDRVKDAAKAKSSRKKSDADLAAFRKKHNLGESAQNGLIGLDQIKKFESVVDKLFAKYNIDFNFTRHFGDRMDDSRNNPSITLKELAEFIKKMYKRQGKSIKGVAGAEAVLKDIQSDLNIPVAVTYDRNNDEFDVVLKTIMRKKNFTSPDKVIKYEEKDMSNQLPEGFMDAILGKNMKNRDSGNAELDEVFGATIGLGFIASTLIKVAATTLMGAIIGGEIGASRKKSAGWTARPRRENSILDLISDKATLKTMQKKYPEALEMIGKNKDIINYSKSITNTKGGPDKEQMQTLKKMIKDEFEKSGISWSDFISSVEPLVRKSVKDAKKKIDESVDLDEMKEGDRPVWLSVYLDHKIMAIHTTEKAGRKYKVGGDGPDGHFLVKTTRKALGKRRVGQFVPRSIGKHLDNGPYPHDDGPQYSVHKESVELDELKTKESKHTKKYKKMFGETKPCWDGYVARGMKKKGDKMVPNCVPEETVNEAKGKGTWGKADKDLAAKVKSESLEYRRLPEGFMDSLAERDYKKERKNYLGTPEQMERNAGRSRARRLAIKKGMAERGDGKDIHHKDKNPLNNDPKNLSSVTQKYNRSEPRKRKVNEIAEFGQVPDMATLVAFAIAGRMTVQAVRAMWYTAKGMMKIKRWASRTGHKIANSANPAPNYTQFESKRLDELSPKTKKAYSDKATRAAGNEKKYADSYSAAAKADPSDPNYKKRGDQHKRKLANRKKGIEKANEKYDINKSKEERKSVLDERMFDRMFAGKAKKDDGTRSQADRTMKKYSPKKWAVELKRRQDAEKNGPAPVIKTQAHAHKKTDKGPKGIPHIHVADHNHKQFGG